MHTVNLAEDAGLMLLLVLMRRQGIDDVQATEQEVTDAIEYCRGANKTFLLQDVDGVLSMSMMDKDHAEALQAEQESDDTAAGRVLN